MRATSTCVFRIPAKTFRLDSIYSYELAPELC